MPLYRIADVIVSMEPRFVETADWYKPYLYTGDAEPDIVVDVTDEDIDYYVREGVDITPPISENICFCNKFNLRLIKFYGGFIHSSAVLYKDKVYLFSASSGVGKSTLTKRICRLFPEAVVINDDKPSFRMVNGKCIIYGTPFAGGTPLQKNLSGELGGVVFLERAEENVLERIPASTAIKLLLQQVRLSKNPRIADRFMSVFSEIITNYPFYSLTCTNSDDAALKAFEVMKQD